MRNQQIRRKVLRLTHGVLGTVTDLVLGELYVVFLFSFSGMTSISSLPRMMGKADQMLAQFNYKTIRSALRKKYMTRPSNALNRITVGSILVPTSNVRCAILATSLLYFA